MAARKSCTHLTWAEAKSNSKIGGGSSSSKKPLIPKKIDHGKALTAKVIAKNGASQEDIAKSKTLLKRAKRGEERAAAAAAKREEEKERQRRERMVKPFDLARERMIAMADALENSYNEEEEDGGGGGAQRQLTTKGSQQTMAECRELQVNELLGLEAIYNTDDDEDANKEMRIVHAAKFELLQQLVEQWQMDPENDVLLKKITTHPPLSCTIQLTVDGIIDDEHLDDGGSGDGIELTAVLLLRVTLPPLYPLGETMINTVPTFGIEYFCCTERQMEFTPDKPLESLTYLDETKLKESMAEEAREISPDPCVYMVITACLMERLFDFVKMSVQGRHILDKYLCQKRSEDEP